ncbi:MAG: DUF3501 family protein [Parvibaculum sp.]|jgi:hypothetical protein|uniref:DUF3501 family protein n=1 Tax=Parvibaculum sp. TaxID=2024848 RepID=UPI003C76CDF5
MAAKRAITPGDILPYETYADERKDRRVRITEMKRARRVAVGPFATFYFENYDTMFHQVHEMLHIERGGAEQLADELAAYNPLIPNGSELVATLMFEIDDEVRRDRELRRLTGVENHVYLEVGGLRVSAVVPPDDVERTKADGKTSSVHFLHFPFTAQEIEKFRDPKAQVILAIAHPNYGHMALIENAVRASLAADFA